MSFFEVLTGRSGKRLEVPICIFGKLPMYKDFIRQGRFSPGALVIRGWLDSAFSHCWSTHPEYRAHVIEQHCFVYSSADRRTSTLGVLWGSSDQGHLRRFPFYIMAEVPACERRGLPSLQAVDLMVQMRARVRAIQSRLGAFDSITEVAALVRSTKLKLQRRSEATLREQARRRCPDRPGSLAEKIAFENFDQLRSGRSLSAVRLPLQPHSSLDEQTLRWLEHMRPLKHRRPETLLILGDRARSGLTVLNRRPKPEDIFVFHPTMPGYSGVSDLRGTAERSRQSSDASIVSRMST